MPNLYTKEKWSSQISQKLAKRLATKNEPWISKNFYSYFGHSARYRLWEDHLFALFSIVSSEMAVERERQDTLKRLLVLSVEQDSISFGWQWGQEGILSQGVTEEGFVLRNLSSFLSVSMFVCSTNGLSDFVLNYIKIKHRKIKYNPFPIIFWFISKA